MRNIIQYTTDWPKVELIAYAELRFGKEKK